MRLYKLVFTIIFAPLLFACKGPYISSSWKMPGSTPKTYSKILVVGIIIGPDTVLRSRLEKEVADNLKKLGYNAVSAMDEYGEKGLANLEEEATYIKLCERGVDAIISIGLLDKAKDVLKVSESFKYNSNLFYYNRIWNTVKLLQIFLILHLILNH